MEILRATLFDGIAHTVLASGESIQLEIPLDARVTREEGRRAIMFKVSASNKPKDLFGLQFKCFSDRWQPGDTVTARIMITARNGGTNLPILEVRCVARSIEVKPTHRLGIITDAREFADWQAQDDCKCFSFQRPHHPGGIVLEEIGAD